MRRKRSEGVIATHPHPGASEAENLYTKTTSTSVCSPLSATLAGIIVQISQHSNFEQDQYIRYQSSLSTQGALSLLSPHRDSELGEASPSSISSLEKADQNGIVPDSQSLAGSSDYVPSPSATSASELTSSNQSAGDISIVHSSRIADRFDLDSSLPESEATHTSDALSSSVVSASEGLVISSQRSRSAPLQLSSAKSRRKPSSRCGAIAQLFRRLSDPSPIIPDSLEQVSSTQLAQTPIQRDNSSSGTKELNKNTHFSYPSQKLNSSPELDFQTQISLVLDSQTTQASTELVGKYIFSFGSVFGFSSWQF